MYMCIVMYSNVLKSGAVEQKSNAFDLFIYLLSAKRHSKPQHHTGLCAGVSIFCNVERTWLKYVTLATIYRGNETRSCLYRLQTKLLEVIKHCLNVINLTDY